MMMEIAGWLQTSSFIDGKPSRMFSIIRALLTLLGVGGAGACRETMAGNIEVHTGALMSAGAVENHGVVDCLHIAVHHSC